jgi:fibronectin-binding autotransporter adhesin
MTVETGDLAPSKCDQLEENMMRKAVCKFGLLASVILGTTTGWAQVTWTGTGDNLWTNANNWFLFTAPVDGEDIVFDANATGNLSTDLGQPYSINKLTVADVPGAVTISNFSLTLGAGGLDMGAAAADLTLRSPLTLGADQTWNVGAGRTLTMATTFNTAGFAIDIGGDGNQSFPNLISGGGTNGLRKSGAGTLTLSYTGGNSFSGGVFVAGGTVKTTSDYGTARVPGGSTITVSTGGTLWVSGINSMSATVMPRVRIQGGNLIVEGFHQHLGLLTLSDATVTTLGTGKYQGEDWAQDSNIVAEAGTSSITLGNSMSLNALRTFTVADGAALTINGRMVNGQVTKDGGGRLALAGTNSINGTLTISNGTVALEGVGAISNVSSIVLGPTATLDLAASAGFTLAASQQLIGSGTVTGVVAVAGGARIHAGAAGVAGTLSFAGDLTLPGAANLIVDLPFTNAPADPHDRVPVVGTLTLNGDAIQVASGALNAPGTYTVLTYGAKSGSFAPAAIKVARQAITVDESVANQIRLIVAAGSEPANLRWDGLTSNAWDTALTTNWYNNGTLAADAFFANDVVTFDDTPGVATQVVIAAGGVVPGQITLATTNHEYTLAGPGGIGGAGGLRKTGPAGLILAATNSFTGELEVQEGWVRAGSASAFGQSTSVVVAAGAQVQLAGFTESGLAGRFRVAGAGPDGAGAITSTNGPMVGAASGVKFLTLSGDAALGGYSEGTNDAGRFDVGTGGGWIEGGGYTLTKLGPAPIPFRGVVSNLAALVISNGLVYAEDNDLAIGTNVVVYPGGRIGGYNGRVLGTAVRLEGGALIGFGTASRWTNTLTAATDSYIINDATVAGYVAGDIILAGPIGGPGRLTKLSGSATYLRAPVINEGGWVVNGGTLTLDSSLVSTGGVTVSNGTFQIGSYGVTSSIVLSADVTVDSGRELRWNNALPLVFTNSIRGNGMVRREDLTGRLEWRGTNTMDFLALGSEAALRSTNNPLVLAGDSVTFTRDLDLGYTAFAAYGRLEVQDRAALILANFDIGNDSGGYGDILQNGGSVTVTGNVNGGTFGVRIGHWDGGTNVSFYTLQSGRLEVIGDTGANGVISCGWDGAGCFNLLGGTAVVRAVTMDNAGADRSPNNLNLEGGVLSVGQLINNSGGNYAVNLGGGRLAAHANWTASVTLNVNGTNGLTVFDSSTNIITVSGAINGTGGLVKVGSGRLDLAGANAFTGLLDISNGAVRVTGGNLPNNPATTIHVKPGARLTLNRVNDFGGGHGTALLTPVIVEGGTLESLGDSETRVPPLTLRGATVELNGGDTAGAWGSLFIPDGISVAGAALSLITNDPAVADSSLRVGSNTVFTVEDAVAGAASDLDVWAPILATPAGMAFVEHGITKAGPGTMTLINTNNTYNFTHISNGTLAVVGVSGTGAVDVAMGATLAGTGLVRGDVTNAGTVSPGLSAGTLTLQKALTQLPGSTLAIELAGLNAGTEYDVLAVAGAVSLDGTLLVTTSAGFVPAVANTFTVLTAASITGAFTSTNLPALGPGLGWDVQYAATAVSLVVTGAGGASPTPYEQWAESILNPAERGEQADPDGDGYANLLEYSQGTDATNSADNAKLSLVRSNGQFLVLFNRVNSATDIVYEVEGAYLPTNNATWLGIATNVIGSWGSSTNVNDNNTAAVHRVLVTDLEIGTNRSLRLKVTRP